jgi:hypothetical protein
VLREQYLPKLHRTSNGQLCFMSEPLVVASTELVVQFYGLLLRFSQA